MAEPYELTEPTMQISVATLDNTGWQVPVGWYGFVRAAGTGIIHVAGIDRDIGMAALVRLCAPEAESRNPANGGRRMARIDGGYLVLNFFAYRDRDHTAADRMRRLRQRKKAGKNVTRNSSIGAESMGSVTANATNMGGKRSNNGDSARHIGESVTANVTVSDVEAQRYGVPVVSNHEKLRNVTQAEAEAEAEAEEENTNTHLLSTEDVCTDPEVPASVPPRRLMYFRIKGPSEDNLGLWGITQADFDRIADGYRGAGIDIMAELRKAKLWCAANPTKQKTAKGMMRFLASWMERAQNNYRGDAAPVKPGMECPGPGWTSNGQGGWKCPPLPPALAAEERRNLDANRAAAGLMPLPDDWRDGDPYPDPEATEAVIAAWQAGAEDRARAALGIPTKNGNGH